MNENAASPGFFSGLATKALAIVVLLVAAWILFKLVIGVVAAVAWVVVAVLAVVAVLWAMSALRR
jgi:predicted membrane protein